jgi:hypothetical protein
MELYLHSPIILSRRGAKLIKKHRDSFIFTFNSFPVDQLHVLRYCRYTLAVPFTTNGYCLREGYTSPLLFKNNNEHVFMASSTFVLMLIKNLNDYFIVIP